MSSIPVAPQEVSSWHERCEGATSATTLGSRFQQQGCQNRKPAGNHVFFSFWPQTEGFPAKSFNRSLEQEVPVQTL